jgi:hypothetical protein
MRKRCPYDGHTLARIIPAIEELVGNILERLHVDAGYRGHNAPPDDKLKAPNRSGTSLLKSSARCVAAAPSSPGIGPIKNEHRMERNYLHHRHGERHPRRRLD